MKKKAIKKNPHAVALAKKSATALTPAQRTARARRAVQARWRKAKPNAYPEPQRWYGLFAVGDDVNHPEVLLWSKDKAELRERDRTEDRQTWILDVDYDPIRFTIHREYKPDMDAMQRLLQVDLGGGQS